MEQKSLYIVLTRTKTLVSKLIHYMTGDMYTHASISLDKNLCAMYSFGRKRRYNPLIGSFCQENLYEGVFADCKVLPYAIIQVQVTQKQYGKANSLIQTYIKNTEQYRYNYAGLLFAWIGKAYKCSHRFYCSEFVYDLLRQCQIICEDPPASIRPQELTRYGKIIEQGDWNEYREEVTLAGTSELFYVPNPIYDMVYSVKSGNNG